MSDPLFEGDDDANTPLEAEEREQLIPSYITTRAELNEAELVNIADAIRWLGSRKHKLLNQDFLNELHKRMFGDVWKWAGQYRLSGVITRPALNTVFPHFPVFLLARARTSSVGC
jgi:fido (protein-threonine AMPylation protein)